MITLRDLFETTGSTMYFMNDENEKVAMCKCGFDYESLSDKYLSRKVKMFYAHHDTLRVWLDTDNKED